MSFAATPLRQLKNYEDFHEAVDEYLVNCEEKGLKPESRF